MPRIISADGSIRISGSIIHQVKELLNIATNDGRFGIKVSVIIKEGYSKQSTHIAEALKLPKNISELGFSLPLMREVDLALTKLQTLDPNTLKLL